MVAGYEERSALQVMSNMDKRTSSRPDDHFYAMMGAISTALTDFSGTIEPCEAFMALCESKGDYSFIYSAAKRDPAFMRRWRPVAGDLPSILPWHSWGAGQPGHKEGSALYLDFMMTFQRSPIEEDGKDMLGNGYQLSTPPIRNYNCHCIIRLTLLSRPWGLEEVRNVSPRPKAIFFLWNL